jgi:zinc protease
MATSKAALPILLLLLAGPWAAAARAQQGAERLGLDPAVTMGTLDNGLRYYVRANGRPEKRAELWLVVNAGSVLEDEDQRGLAHFVEHMAFNGTAGFEKQALVNYLESIGMQFGADLNAYTGFDETVYMLTVPTDTGPALATGIRILEEWAHLVTFDSTEIEKERGVVIEEWRLGQGAEARLRDKVFPVLLRGSRYAERLPIGSRESLQAFDPAALRRFYHEWYRPELMAVIAIGDFDAGRVEALIRERFGGIARPEPARARTEYPVADHEEMRVAVATDPEATSTTIEVYFKQPPGETGTVAAYRRSLAARLFNSMLNARLGELARLPNPPFIGASSGYGSLLRTKAAWVVGGAVREGEVLRGLDAVLSEAERVSRHGFTESELQRQKANVQRAYEVALAERDKTESAAYANEYVRHFLEGEASPGIEAEFELLRRLLPDIGLDEIETLSGEWMTERNRVVVVQGPQKEGVTTPAEAEIVATFAAVRARELAAYQDVVTEAPLVAEPPAPGRVTAESRDSALGLLDWRLSNGVRVLLRPTDFKNDEVLVRGFSPGGLSLVSDADFMSGGFAAILVSASGLGDRDATQLQKALAGRAVSVRPSLDELTESISGSASPRDLETLFQLIYLNMTAPRNDSAAFTSLMARMRGLLANRAASPESAFQDTLAVTLAQHHPRARPITEAVLEEVGRDRAHAIYRDRFADAGDFTFVVVGSFQPDSIRPLVLRYLGGLPAAGRIETWRDSGMEPPAGVVEKVVRRGVEPKAETAIVFTGALEAWDRPTAQRLESLGSVLEIRLREVLREDLGGTYGVSVGQTASRLPEPRYAVTLTFGAAPERIDSLATVVFSEIERLKAEGPDSATLAKVQEAQRRDHETRLRENGYWLGEITSALLTGERPGAFLEYPALVAALTPAAIAETARLLDRTRYVRVTLLPQTRNPDPR